MATEREPARARILAAARSLVARGGAAGISMGDVGAAAGVSKALVHYHFKDKDSLLRAVVERAGRDAIEREAAAMRATGERHALDDYWSWFADELARGDIRILTALGEYDNASVREAARAVAVRRRAVAADHVSLVFARLGLAPRVPATLIAETLVAVMDGLAAAQGLDPRHDARPAFDTLWLALLTLAE